nr:PAS domain-containing protein [Terriglobus albidus]
MTSCIICLCATVFLYKQSDTTTADARQRPFDVRLAELSEYVWSRTSAGDIEYISPAGCEYLGVSMDEMQDFSRFIHPDDISERQDAMKRAQNTGEPQQFHARYRSASGKYCWFATLLHSQRDSKGAVIRYFGLQWNIDAQKRQEEEMRARDDVWKAALKILPGWMWLAKPDGSPEFMSPGALEYTGLTSGQMLKDTFVSVHPDDCQPLAAHWKRLLESGAAGEIEIRIRRADGVYRWFISRAKPLHQHGNKIERWVNINWDIDERRGAEEQTKKAEEIFRKIADGVPACICIMAPDGTMVYANRVASMALGKPMEQILGNQWMQHIHPEQYEEAHKNWMHCVTTQTPLDTRWLMLHHDGQYRWQHILAHPAFDEHHRLASWYMMGVEIDQQMKAEQALRNREREVRELLNRIPTLIAVRSLNGIEFVNDRFLEYVGRSLESVLGNGWLVVAHPEDRQRVFDLQQNSTATIGPLDMVWRIADKESRYRWFHTHSEPFFELDGSVQRWYSVTTDIDDLFRSRELIRDHKMQLHLLAENVPGFLWKALPSGEVTYLNRYCEDYLGMTPDEVRSTGWIHLVHPEDQDEVLLRWNTLVNGGQWHEHVHRLKGKDGQYRWFQSLITTVKDNSGNVVTLHGLTMDAHTMVSAERSVRQEERQLRRLVDAMPAMIWRADPNGQIDRWNRTMVQTIGKPWETSENFDLKSKIDPSQASEVETRWERSVRFGIPYEDTYRILGNDGNYHWHLVRAQPFRDENGKLISWYGVHTDIEALKQAEEALQEREQQLLGIIETVPSMLWSASSAGEPTHINRRVREYSGLSLDRFFSLGWEALLHPDDFEDTANAFSKAVKTGESYSAVHRLRRADGEYRWYHARGEPLRDREGKIIQWYCLSVDIDERKRAEDHLRQTRAKLNRASRIATVAELSASIAHELNQPLMSVLANAQAGRRWLATSPPNIEEANASIERIIRDGRAADERMQHIRALFKRESFDKKEVSVQEIISEAIRLVQEDQNKRSVQINCVCESELPLISVDPIQIQEVIVNLISNAIEANDHERRPPLVTIKAQVSAKREMIIQVIDNGPGVDDPEKIFDAFVTTKEDGMGIGLAVSRSIVEAHEGQLWAENNPDVGAIFTLTLPLPKRARNLAAHA